MRLCGQAQQRRVGGGAGVGGSRGRPLEGGAKQQSAAQPQRQAGRSEARAGQQQSGRQLRQKTLSSGFSPAEAAKKTVVKNWLSSSPATAAVAAPAPAPAHTPRSAGSKRQAPAALTQACAGPGGGGEGRTCWLPQEVGRGSESPGAGVRVASITKRSVVAVVGRRIGWKVRAWDSSAVEGWQARGGLRAQRGRRGCGGANACRRHRRSRRHITGATSCGALWLSLCMSTGHGSVWSPCLDRRTAGAQGRAHARAHVAMACRIRYQAPKGITCVPLTRSAGCGSLEGRRSGKAHSFRQRFRAGQAPAQGVRFSKQRAPSSAIFGMIG
jgi:hypothetical protein